MSGTKRPPSRLGTDALAFQRENIQSEYERRLFEHIDAIEAELATARHLLEVGLLEVKAECEMLMSLLEAMRKSRDELARRLEERSPLDEQLRQDRGAPYG